ncbi:uncharacterized protein At3g27210-like isoform X1 [Olea europaea var. sylvestris]|uniref:uncharacterized protein At3g27210-like isoform X1 n=1 Tax=Olea europaea var. sylvestris TaxID=158386 RepID=UPI000C1D11B4|nr:uncharacterized protein At3g27210-like isoform X1 [Olea europaea var. sylvestris]
MGSCVSVHKDHESAMKLRLSYGSKNDKLVSTGGDPTVADMALKSNPIYNVRDFGSKEETFFDTQPWLESDCEDDFSSINGDFIPSRGSTPVHHSSSVGNPVSVPVSSPADKKKKLSDLFKESLQVDRDLDEQHVVGNLNVDAAEVKAEVLSVDLPPKSADERPNVSGAIFAYTSERTLNVVFRPEDKSAKSCLPRLISSRSFSERRNRMSPSRSVG